MIACDLENWENDGSTRPIYTIPEGQKLLGRVTAAMYELSMKSKDYRYTRKGL